MWNRGTMVWCGPTGLAERQAAFTSMFMGFQAQCSADVFLIETFSELESEGDQIARKRRRVLGDSSTASGDPMVETVGASKVLLTLEQLKRKDKYDEIYQDQFGSVGPFQADLNMWAKFAQHGPKLGSLSRQTGL